jgi:hypothetical protein
MMNSPLADMITRTQGAPNKTCVEYMNLLHHQTEPHKIRASRGVFMLVSNQEGRA